MKLTLVTDAWEPQANGVVRTLATTVRLLAERGVRVQIIAPDQFWRVPVPSQPDIRLAMTTRRRIGKLIRGFAPDALHIATEGQLGWQPRFDDLETMVGHALAWERHRLARQG